MAEVLINRCYGGFGLSEAAIEMLQSIDPKTDEYDWSYTVDRSDPALLEVYKKLGRGAFSGYCADVHLVEIKPGRRYRIDEYDGYEYIEYRDDIEWRIG